mgnify:CR=1 FL=1
MQPITEAAYESSEEEEVEVASDTTGDGGPTSVDHMSFDKIIGMPPGRDGAAWARAGLVGRPYTHKIRNIAQVESVLQSLTTPEQKALERPIIHRGGVPRKAQPKWKTTDCLRKYPDLEARVLPKFWMLLWKLVDARNAQEQSSLPWIRKAKAEAYEFHTTLLDAFRYLLETRQFCPRGQDMWAQVRQFSHELGNYAVRFGNVNNVDLRCKARAEVLKNMFRGFVFHLGQDDSDHTNCVTAMCMLLDRIELELPMAADQAPWYLPAYSSTHKYQLTSPTSKPDVSDCDLQSPEVEENNVYHGRMELSENEVLTPRTGQASSSTSVPRGERETAVPKMSKAMVQKVKNRWPTEINDANLKTYADMMVRGIPNDGRAGEEPIGACAKGVAKKHERALMRGLYICLEIHEQGAVNADFSIADGTTALQLMTRHYPNMVVSGGFSQFCFSNPTPEKPYAFPGRDNNPSPVIDWRQAFRRWMAVFAQ